MERVVRKRIGEILVDANVVTEANIQKALKEKHENEVLGETLIRLGMASEYQILNALDEVTGSKRVNLTQEAINSDAISLFDGDYCRNNIFIPFKVDDESISIAINDPLNYFVLNDIRFKTNKVVIVYTALKDDILNAIEKHYSLTKVLGDLAKERDFNEVSNEEPIESSPMIRFVNQIIQTAVASRASDIHIDPLPNKTQIKYRVDSVLYPELSLPKSVHKKIVSRIKVMAKLNITETRLPQDGRISEVINGQKVDLRVSVLPTINGEKVVMRILELKMTTFSLGQLGFSTNQVEKITNLIHAPYGIILVSGPTGSGKSTSLYTILNMLNDSKLNIITVEDPVEMQMDGINQVQVREDLDLTFANALRSILRQDPDIIMIGEIRDSETAQIAIQAALTGHLVLSTVHTNNSIDTIVRLMDMGIEPFLLSNALICVIAQRLVRKLCPECSKYEDVTENEKNLFAKHGFNDVKQVKRPVGCSYCGNKGYIGRTGIYEMFVINEHLREMISKNMTTEEIRKYCQEKGMVFLIEDGLNKIIKGITSVDEVLGATYDYGND